jgi:competence protein ComEA
MTTPRSGDLDFGRRNRSSGGPKVRVMAGILAVVTAAAVAVHRSSSSPPAVVAQGEVVVEVRGDVPSPGFHPIPPPVTVARAVAAAGGPADLADHRELPPGSRVTWAAGTAEVGLMDDTLVVGVPVDINRATAAALEALPGVGPSRSRDIVEERETNGPYTSVDALTRVKGIGPATVEKLRPFVQAQPKVQAQPEPR